MPAEVRTALTWVGTAAEALDAVEAGVRRDDQQAPPTEREVLESEP